MAEIKCPMCGKPNPAELAVCQFCEARLKPLTDELGRSQTPIHPGEEPRDMDTGQLENTLPHWLREIRQQAREADKDESGQSAAKPESGQQEENADFLAGLQSQGKSEEEIPDWLAGLRGEGGQVGFEDSETESGESNELPSWALKRGDEGMEQAEQAGSNEEPAQIDSDFHWEADFGTQPGPDDSAEGETLFDSELPDWLGPKEPSLMEDENKPFIEESELPAWLQDKQESPTDNTDIDLPAWLASLGGEESGETPSPQGAGQPEAKSTTDWLASFEEESNRTGPPQSTDSAIKSTTDWLTSLEADTAQTDAGQEPAGPAPEGEMPDWLSSLGENNAEQVSQREAEEPAEVGDLPDWLASLGEQSTTSQAEDFSSTDELIEPSQAASEAEIPDWLAAMGEGEDTTVETEQPLQESELLAVDTGMSIEEASPPSAFVDDEGRPISKEDVEAIFSMDMPDWLSDAGMEPDLESPTPPVEPPQEGELRPAELPTWVEALRPVESVIPSTEGLPPEEQPVEERGPLAGLRGVLPAVAGVELSSKPKGYSFKLQVSEDQQASAALLEKLLSEEITPEPAITQKVVLTQRILRWIVAALLLLVVGATVYYGSQINPVPTGVPPETSSAWNYIKDTLPANAPVLLVFDYNAARAGELEAAAAPLVDQMLTLKAPRLSLVAFTPTGSGLAERFMRILQTDRQYARNENFINLGYLPGGAAGVQAFAQDPVTTRQLTTTGENAWTTPVLEDVSQLSNFASIILLTDDLETARIWIEQTEGKRGEARFLVVSSAQSGPLILPYVRSGQVDGMVTGLGGGAPIEQANSGRPGMARRYWDAYGFGLLAAVAMILIGSLWSLISRWQTLRKERREA